MFLPLQSGVLTDTLFESIHTRFSRALSATCFSKRHAEVALESNHCLDAFFFFFGHGIDESVKASQMSATEEKCKK